MKNKTNITKNQFIECNEIIYKFYYSKITIIYEVLLALFIVLLVSIEKYILALVFALVLICFPILLNRLFKKKSMESIDKLFTGDYFLSYEYTFNDDYFIVNVIRNDKSKEYSYEYKNLKRIVEKDNAYYIFIEKASAFAVDKNSFSFEDKHNFKTFIKNKVKKYEVL